MTKTGKKDTSIICLLWLGILLLLFANLKMKVYLEQLRDQTGTLTQRISINAMMLKKQPPHTMEDILARSDAQLVTVLFSDENYAAEAKSVATLCDKEFDEKMSSVSNESVLSEMQRRPGMYGRLSIPSVGVNVALFTGSAQSLVDAPDSAAYFPAGNSMLIADHWNQGFTKIKGCHVGTRAYIYKGASIQTLTCTGICQGVNNDYDLLCADGSSATMSGNTLMYTCNGANYHDITITFWS